MTLELRFWGTRGSIPSPGPHTVRYGGNTPCVEVRASNGRLLILDAGTGLRPLGRSLEERAEGKPIAADIFVTHVHWDHIQGLPFFEPLFRSGNRFRFFGSNTLRSRLERVLRDQMAPAVFPVSFDDLSASLDVCEFGSEDHIETACTVDAFDVRHPGGALAYRLRDGAPGARPVVYVSDNELGPGGSALAGQRWRGELVDFTKGARLLVHDATYLPEEYEAHRGWGHSTCEEAVELALEAGVEELLLFHHAPERSDDDVDRMVERCRQLVRDRAGSLAVSAAAEGLTVTV